MEPSTLAMLVHTITGLALMHGRNAKIVQPVTTVHQDPLCLQPAQRK